MPEICHLKGSGWNDWKETPPSRNRDSAPPTADFQHGGYANREPHFIEVSTALAVGRAINQPNMWP